MLSQETKNIIKSTVPVLEVHGVTITSTFYKNLFSKNPSLLNIFNHANQRQGNQQTALANSILAAAQHIDSLEAILPVVKAIGHKHRALGVLPEHYPIVGKELLIAIKEVLGEAATPEILNAWGSAYQVIADVFIQVEKELYAESESGDGAWKGFIDFVVDKKVVESEKITSFYFKKPDGSHVAPFIPGQYISVKIHIGEYDHIRHYSLSSVPISDTYRISIKKENGVDETTNGIVSCYLHNNIKVGDRVQLATPAGSFVIDTSKDTPLLLLCGGIGISPLLSMLETTLEKQPNRKVTFITSNKNAKLQAFKGELKKLSNTPNCKVFIGYSSPNPLEECDFTGKLTQEILEGFIQKDEIPTTDVFICGPLSYMKSMNNVVSAMGYSADKINYEVFGPLAPLK
ncbi:flavohemoglobin [Tieghemostelium lacteum]|uniref:nitric oxide dioxygenase n=1 Tax=Tieghemostelium lacteum TaxID=361077 RepID=A0A151Z355_TIELA|nr:flavohemoglobin [Tieghemostelium lacteum]|eukprot:KYQ88379.1 flavohemoglobin [Tieghemostelium lacteum]